MTSIEQRLPLRRRMRATRSAMPPLERLRASAAVAALLRGTALVRHGDHVALYWAVQGELPLLDIVHVLTSLQCQLYLPVVGDEQRLRFAPWQHGMPMQPNRYGIPEPVVAPDTLRDGMSLDVVLVPLVAFDRLGNRLGSGAGFYDRSFAALAAAARPARPRLVGIGYSVQEVPVLPAQSWDVRLDHVLTERELITMQAV